MFTVNIKTASKLFIKVYSQVFHIVTTKNVTKRAFSARHKFWRKCSLPDYIAFWMSFLVISALRNIHQSQIKAADKLFKRGFVSLPWSRTKWRIHRYSLKIQLMKHWNYSKIYSDCRLFMNVGLKIEVNFLFVLSPCSLICQWSVVWACGAQWLPNW